ncbi:MAG TPA: heterodisulfide reductase-related iron-sulfur binding cluster [Casimicrobiaceae bacterium]|nr:heterodisulfide reductase-related iron-sulfur binding cluster [Casimicrobiaceae bacterium]
MTIQEGSLEAPTRHPLDWRNPEFFDKEALEKEMERIFDICHGCRRCVSLCQSFPTLFDLVDESKSGEIDGVDRKDYWKVVDQCYLCDLCYMTKCPYVPPHPWNVDFPHLMLRGKAYKFKTQGANFRDRMLTGTDRMGKLASIPVVAQTINWANSKPSTRSLLEKTLGVAKEAALPKYAKPFRKNPPRSLNWPVRNGMRTPGKVAIFATCYINYNEPNLARDLTRILEHNSIPYVLAEKEVCCGMPKLELGDLESVEELKDVNIPVLAALAREGYAILTGVPSCTLMFKQELPLMFPDDEDVKLVRDTMFDPFEYLVARDKDGLLRKDFKRSLGKIAYHVPCHSRVQNVGQKTREALEWISDTTVATIERCAGHDGTYGVKEEFYADSMKIGKPVFRRVSEEEPDIMSSDCPIAGRRIAQGVNEIHPTRARIEHPLTLLRMAYGLD